MLFFSGLPLNTKAKIVWIHPNTQMRLAGSPLRFGATIVRLDADKVLCNNRIYRINGLEKSLGVQIVTDDDEGKAK